MFFVYNRPIKYTKYFLIDHHLTKIAKEVKMTLSERNCEWSREDTTRHIITQTEIPLKMLIAVENGDTLRDETDHLHVFLNHI